MERTLEKEKAKCQEVEEQRLKGKLETELALAKMDWNKVSRVFVHCWTKHTFGYRPLLTSISP
jgi:hypothetical protein